MIIREIKARTILTRSLVYDYSLNPYVGCQHECRYCYAMFMRRFTGHSERWGDFVDVKINAPELLSSEIKKKGRVWISGVCDPYQPVERKYRLTRRCLEILIDNNWPVTIQTKSPLVLRDRDVLVRSDNIEVGFTITTADERIRRIFEPHAPPVDKRIEALRILHSGGIKTFAMIAPILPGAEGLVDLLYGKVDYIILDRLNYHYADWVYRKYKLLWAKEDRFFICMIKKLKKEFEKRGIECLIVSD
ncbi:MAG: radical SAM protein [Thermodesulfovibrionales bacterium]|nr:radical SAM protein [Thermodesulfovibrionales bacterium]